MEELKASRMLKQTVQQGRTLLRILRLEAGNAVTDCVLGQIGGGMKVQQQHDAVLMELHRFHRHIEDRGNLLRAAAFSNKLQHFPLAVGERGARRLDCLAGGSFAGKIQHILGQGRRQVLLALENRPDG